MVQGLAFLSKKSWHTKNIANQERVWIEEQKKAAEDSKTQELAKQIQQEREDEELDRVAGKKSKRLDRGIDWMYQGVMSEAAEEDAKKEAEEYLMGKEFTGTSSSTQPVGDLAQAEDEMTGVNAVLSSVTQIEPEHPSNEGRSSIMTGPSVSDRNEAFRMRIEDPMFLVSQKRREQEVKVEKKKALYEKVVGNIDDDEDSRRRRKRERKERKKDRKHRKESRRRRDRSRSRSESDEDYRRRSPTYRRRASKSPDDYVKRSRYDDDSDQSYPRRRGERSSRYNCSSPVARLDNRQRRYSNKTSPDGEKKRHEITHRNDDKNQDCSANFGLQGNYKSLDLKDLGPNRDLVSKRRKEQEAERDRRKPAPRRRMTPEEREQALREMQANAKKHNVNRMAKGRTEDDEGERKSASFLLSMAEQTHGIHGEHITMSERIARNRHTNQKSNDAFF